ncbi:MAG: translocation and assembly module TamA [Methyloprofundus sp.]|nr:MAG: translocation and assembly module TamA [Methyloprofundus sp.]
MINAIFRIKLVALIFPVTWFIGLVLLQLSLSTALLAAPDITITGLSAEQEANVRAYLPLSRETCSSPRWKVTRLFEQSPKQVQQALHALGYYHPKIGKALEWEEECWSSAFSIEPGAAMLISLVDIQVLGAGSSEGFFSELLQKNSIKQGDIVNHGTYDDLKKRLQALANAKGYFDSHFELKQLIVDPDKNRAEIRLHLQTGRRYYISRLELDENALSVEFSSQYLTIKPNQAYDRDNIIKSHQQLDFAEYFQDIQLKFLKSQAINYHAPLQVKLRNLPQHVLSAGVGYDTDLGFRLSAGYKNRYLNDSGHKFIADLNLSLKKSNLLLEYIWPLSNPLKDRLSFFAGITYEDTDHVDSQKIDLGIKLSNKLYGQLIMAEQLNFVAERYRNAESDPFETRFLLVPGISLSNVRAAKDELYVNGYKYLFKLNGAHRKVGSGVSFIQAQLNIKFAYATLWGGRILVDNNFGATGVDIFADLPSSYRFYAGGDNSVRGYDYKSIGQRDENGEVIGGRYLVTTSLEYEQQIVGNWSLAAFIDAGDAFSKDIDMQVGVGVGLRWYSLVGPLRVDIAMPTEDWSDVHFHFSLSTAL